MIIYKYVKDEWVRFEDQKPEPFQEIFIVWPSGMTPPEYRRWSEEMNQYDWSMMRWLPCPPYPAIQ